MAIGIVGLGAVGTAVLEGMRLHHDVHGYDIDGRGHWDRIISSDALFICVPTDGTTGGGLDSEVVEGVVSRVSDSAYEGLIIVKSTLQPGTMSRLQSIFPSVRIVYMPEFLREKDAAEWFQNPDRLVAAGSPEDVEEAFGYFEWVPESTPRLAMSELEAEIGKIAHNSFIATKVTFTCEVERICKTFDADPQPVMEVVWRDRRVQNRAHLTPGLGGFDGKCIPKDTQALRSLDVDTPLLDTVYQTGSKDAVRKKMSDISSKPIDSNNATDTMKKDVMYSILFAIMLVPLIIGSHVLIYSIFDTAEIDEPAIHIISMESDQVDVGVGDYVTILNINSTMLGSQSSSHTACFPNGNGGSDCHTSITQHLTMAVNSANNSYELSSEDFLEDCFGRECAATGVVREIREDVRWLVVEEYYVIG